MPDKIILLTFAHAIVICGLLYIFPIHSVPKCNQFKMIHYTQNNGDSYTTNDTLTFRSYVLSGAQPVIWLFSDNSIQTGTTINHNFRTAGRYIIKAVSCNCSCSQTVLITTRQTTTDSIFIPEIEGESATITSIPIRMTVAAPNGLICYWKTPDQDSMHYGNKTTFIFNRPGEKIIRLYNSADSQLLAFKKIKVYPAIPTAPSPIPHKEKHNTPQYTSNNISITEDDFRFCLLQILAKQLKPTDIVKYLCNPQHTRVLINDSQTNDLMAFCNELYGKKKTQIQQVTLIKDSSGCIQEVRINVNKKRLINLF